MRGKKCSENSNRYIWLFNNYVPNAIRARDIREVFVFATEFLREF